jgi:hypothetical protein
MADFGEPAQCAGDMKTHDVAPLPNNDSLMPFQSGDYRDAARRTEFAFPKLARRTDK